MKTVTLAAVLSFPLWPALVALAGLTACDEPKSDTPAIPEAAAPAPAPTPIPTPTPTAAPAPTFVKKAAADCKAHPAAVDFGDDAALEKEVRRKLSKDKGPITPSDLATIKSINLANAPVHQVDPCIFPMFTAMTSNRATPSRDSTVSEVRVPLSREVTGNAAICRPSGSSFTTHQRIRP